MNNDKRPLISVCIANFNGEHLLLDCITSVLTQRGEFDLEVLVHDDASTDASMAVLNQFPQVRLIVSECNVGFCVANNRMVNEASGHYILLLNNDAALFHDAIDNLVRESERSARPRILSLPQYDWETAALVDRGCLLDPFNVPTPNLLRQRKQVAYVIGACLWMKRTDWLRLGGFPEWMGSIGEDLFLCSNARLQGMTVEVIQQSGYRHRQGMTFGGNRVGADGLMTNYRRRRLSETNRAATLVICMPGLIWFPWALLHASVLAVEGIVVCVFKRSYDPWRKIYGATLSWLWGNKLMLMSVRGKIQGTRKVRVKEYVKGGYTWRFRKLSILLRHGFPKIN